MTGLYPITALCMCQEQLADRAGFSQTKQISWIILKRDGMATRVDVHMILLYKWNICIPYSFKGYHL